MFLDHRWNLRLVYNHCLVNYSIVLKQVLCRHDFSIEGQWGGCFNHALFTSTFLSSVFMWIWPSDMEVLFKREHHTITLMSHDLPVMSLGQSFDSDVIPTESLWILCYFLFLAKGLSDELHLIFVCWPKIKVFRTCWRNCISVNISAFFPWC